MSDNASLMPLLKPRPLVGSALISVAVADRSWGAEVSVSVAGAFTFSVIFARFPSGSSAPLWLPFAGAFCERESGEGRTIFGVGTGGGVGVPLRLRLIDDGGVTSTTRVSTNQM